MKQKKTLVLGLDDWIKFPLSDSEELDSYTYLSYQRSILELRILYWEFSFVDNSIIRHSSVNISLLDISEMALHSISNFKRMDIRVPIPRKGTLDFWVDPLELKLT